MICNLSTGCHQKCQHSVSCFCIPPLSEVKYFTQRYHLVFFRHTNKCHTDVEKEKCDNPIAATVCSEGVLVQHLAELEIINPESIVLMAVVNYENLCRNVFQHLDKIHKYLGTCKVTIEHDFYLSLLAGEKTLHKKLCNTPEFTRRFDLYYPCLHELRNDLENCIGPVDWYEDTDEEKVCKSFKYVTDCQYVKAAKVCGIDAAKTIKELTVAIVDSITTVKCSNVAVDPVVNDPMPDSYICGKAETVHSSIKAITFFTFLRLFLI
ncbi:hypothetical protein NQ315_010687 [Exocentrus adspersus]|uniref:Uncharacterized protein n=1 Tax=Exocentrus adspersus TaxID=1586481 RepID=A0AAV8VV64_9CUCU|nr:hypothetical protein NQ315_010687 [Exocentrus adspersus]